MSSLFWQIIASCSCLVCSLSTALLERWNQPREGYISSTCLNACAWSTLSFWQYFVKQCVYPGFTVLIDSVKISNECLALSLESFGKSPGNSSLLYL
ncbi:unnamed protein product [Dicrocoelium dendriticum]|nr:unnamed protein product [Dicrocoelium dendriticum]